MHIVERFRKVVMSRSEQGISQNKVVRTMSMDKLFCSDHKKTSATSWCTDCEKLLCSDCGKNHIKKFKGVTHKIIASDDFLLIPNYALCSNNVCPVHHQECDFFCNDHSFVCCSVCSRESHKDCSDVQLLKSYVRGMKPSTLCVEEEINGHIHALNEIKGLIQENNEDARKEERVIVRMIRQVKQEINTYLESLEKSLKTKLSEDIDEIINNNKVALATLSRKEMELKEMKDNIPNMVKHAGEMQIFFGTRKIKDAMARSKNYLDSLENVKISFESVLSSQALSNTFRSLGQIVVKKEQYKIQQNASRSVHDIKLERQTFIKVKCDPGAVITGCVVLDKWLVFADYHNTMLIVHKKNGSFKKCIMLPGQPSDITVISDCEIAVTIWSLGYICILDPSTESILKQIDTGGKCYGICHSDGMFFVPIEHSNVIQIFNLDGKRLQKVTLPTSGFSYVIKNRNNLMSSNEADNCVKCCSLYGNEIWSVKFKTDHKPHQVTIDSDGFIYVTCFESNNIVILSKDGKEEKIILTEEDGMKNPSAIHFKNNQILVCNSFSGDAHLYKIM